MPRTDPDPTPSEMGSVEGFTLSDLPPHCDMSIMPKGDPRTQSDGKVYVVWEGFDDGLFWSWDEAAKAVNYYSGARHKCYKGLANARLAYYLGSGYKPGACKSSRKRKGASTQKAQTPPATESYYTPPATPRRAERESALPRDPPTPQRAPTSRTSSSSTRSSVREDDTASSHNTPRTPRSDPLPTPSSDRNTFHSAQERGARAPPSSRATSVPPSRSSSRPPASATSTPKTSRSKYREPRIIEVSSSDEDRPPPVYVVLRGSHPGVYLDKATALICLSNSLRCCIREVADTDIANAMFVRWYMSDRVERL